MHALQWHIQGGAWSRPECGLGELHVFPPWVEKHGHDQVGVVDSDAILPPRRFQEDWARDAREDPRVLMSLRIDFGPMD